MEQVGCYEWSKGSRSAGRKFELRSELYRDEAGSLIRHLEKLVPLLRETTNSEAFQ